MDSEKIAGVSTNLPGNAIRYSNENGRVITGAKQKGRDRRHYQSIFDRYFRIQETKTEDNVYL